jgi:peptidoglycan-associated lipoprotein
MNASFASAASKLALLALPVFGLLALSGCKPDYPECKKDKHCKVDEGEKCVEGMCQNCTTDDECQGKGPNGENFVCFEFRCTDPAEAGVTGGGGELGAPCTESMECNGYTCKAGKCDVCMDDTECGGGTCDLNTGKCDYGLGGGGGVCTTDDECAMDEICDGGMCVFSGDYGGGDDGPAVCDLKAIFFGFDSPKLLPDAQQALQNAAECIKNEGRLVYLEAHADPRGTEEYNILLTDKRGQVVKKFLTDLGVPGENMQVISKGSLEATGTSEEGWSQDRRVEFVWP